jgi:hypothetical protein
LEAKSGPERKVFMWEDVLSGVTQGNILGPLPCAIFVNNIDGVLGHVDIIRKFVDE